MNEKYFHTDDERQIAQSPHHNATMISIYGSLVMLDDDSLPSEANGMICLSNEEVS